ncbi:hypothetical protein AAFF_G00009860 [Aldrovandia affinis]|uniref:Uncharacterized protein n=1 Tax=Aldrovandia affinis TaxID=143900 RepID=A0AAD7S7I7_9TELE|nr:hypothetical protein AAFF_G00009860 [Aldrovandia affinis]
MCTGKQAGDRRADIVVSLRSGVSRSNLITHRNQTETPELALIGATEIHTNQATLSGAGRSCTALRRKRTKPVVLSELWTTGCLSGAVLGEDEA